MSSCTPTPHLSSKVFLCYFHVVLHRDALAGGQFNERSSMLSLHALLDKVILQMPKPRSITLEVCSGINQFTKDRHKSPQNKSHVQSARGADTVTVPTPHRAEAVPWSTQRRTGSAGGRTSAGCAGGHSHSSQGCSWPNGACSFWREAKSPGSATGSGSSTEGHRLPKQKNSWKN